MLYSFHQNYIVVLVPFHSVHHSPNTDEVGVDLALVYRADLVFASSSFQTDCELNIMLFGVCAVQRYSEEKCTASKNIFGCRQRLGQS